MEMTNIKFHRAKINVMQLKMDFLSVHHGIIFLWRIYVLAFIMPTFYNLTYNAL